MKKLCLNSRDELIIILLDKVAYFQAQGNYTKMCYIHGESNLLTLGISKIEEYIQKAWPLDKPSCFIRLGRSLIINQTFLTNINVLKQQVKLSDYDGHEHFLTVPKPLLKEYKEKINQFYLTGYNEE